MHFRGLLIQALLVLLLVLPHCAWSSDVSATTGLLSNVASLRKWITAGGGKVSEDIVVTSKAGEGGRGVFAVKALEKDHLLLRLPLDLVLDKHVALAAATPGTHPVDALALFILGEREKGETSEWKAYIDTLPASVPASPLFVETAVVYKQIMPSLPGLAEEVLAFQETIDERFHELVEEGWAQKVTSLSQKSLRWAVAVVLGRLFGVMHKASHDTQGNNGEGGGGDDMPWVKVHGLVPFADLFNTNFPPSALNADCRTDATSTYFECFTTREVAVGDEVWMPYVGADNPDRPVDNLHLWVNYGFVIEPLSGQQGFNEEQDIYEVVRPLVQAAEEEEARVCAAATATTGDI
jgi:hypothetical protein